ncbi:MAG: glucan biosynthesis protein [Gemmatimonadales bacterium]|nr:MAG: glucan biosynthesis protein [Gemmatimonadales bacterium]
MCALALGLATACSQDSLSPPDATYDGVWQEVVRQARERARAPFRAPDSTLSRNAANLSYGQMRGIRFRSDGAAWRDEASFQLQFFHPGGAFRTPVRIHLVEDDSVRPLPFDPALFHFGDEVAGLDLTLPPEAGYAGFRILHPMNDRARWDEVVSFLGASYFRLLGPEQVYGLSSRGLAVNVADPEGEEFPDFVAFWLVKPAPGDRSMTFFGLLDGPSVSGAYRFRLTPGTPSGIESKAGSSPPGDPEARAGAAAGGRSGDDGAGTVLAVEARLFARRDVRKLGVAALTSMYLHGTFRSGGDDDFRPRVHDSEGLLMHTGRGEWIWRPLTNGASLRVTSLRDEAPGGFGLAQRERRFESYLDLEALYHRRPSQWVAVDGGDWGSGGVELVEFPTASEFNDNIVAYWSPDGAMKEGEERTFRYRLVTFRERFEGGSLPGGDLEGQSLGQVVRTRIGWDGLPGQSDPAPRSQRRVVVDFQGGPLERLGPTDSVEAVVQTSSGTISELLVLPTPGGGRRATFSLRPRSGKGADIRLYLRRAGEVVTETWSYLWEPGLAH